MAEFLVEVYLSRGDAVDASAERARRAAQELTDEGTPVLYLSSIFVPEDETCFFLYHAASADAVREAARRASLSFERVCEAVAESKGVLL
jgi:Nickel responsive protein SCO4226-like